MKYAILALLLAGCGKAVPFSPDATIPECGNEIYIKDGKYYSMDSISGASYPIENSHGDYCPPGSSQKTSDGIYQLTGGGYKIGSCSFLIPAS